MWKSRDPETAFLVFKALRQYTSSIKRDLQDFHDDADRIEELDEAIRLTRLMRSAASLAGSLELNRLAALQEELLDSVIRRGGPLDKDALSTVTTMLEAVDAYTVRIESHLRQPAEDAANLREDLVVAVKAYRRYRDLPEDGDDQAIASLFSTSPAVGDAASVEPLSAATATAMEHRQPAEQPVDLAEASGNSVGSAAPAADEPQQEIPAELWAVFRDEASDHLERIYGALRDLERDGSDREVLQEIRRSAHTLKGSAAVIGLRMVSQLSHRAEDLLDALYAGSMQQNPEHLTLLATTADMLSDMLACDGEQDWNERKLRELYDAYDGHCGAAQVPADAVLTPATSGAAAGSSGPEWSAAEKSSRPQPAGFVRVPASRVEGLRRVVSESIVNRAAIEQGVAGFYRCAASLKPVLDMLRDVAGGLAGRGKTSLFGSQRPVLQGEVVGGRSLTDTNSDRAGFDELEFDRFTSFDLWSQSLDEAATAIGAVEQDLRLLADECDALLAEQGRLILDTQDRLFRIQMVPMSTVLPRLQRTVREVASRQGKSVDLLVAGEDVELDKMVLEELVEPLQHMLRNAVDHGIEPAAERTAGGKPAEAAIRISVSHYGTQVVMRISDDGRGLDLDRIRSNAVEGGYVSEANAPSLTPQQLQRHIFLPGFSTVSSISEVSGRGVGMDIVRARIEKLKGRLDVDSSPGQGTAFTIRLPVSLAVTRALMLVAADELYAIPQKAVQSVERVARQDVDSSELHVQIAGQEHPLVNLRDYLGLEPATDPPPDTLLVAMIGSGSQQVALVVDGVLPGRDIVVRSVGNRFAIASGLLGATILGDGSVVPILDPTDLVAGNEAVDPLASFASVAEKSEAPTTIMIVDDSVSMRQVLQNVIEREGWLAVTARDGLDALETLGAMEQPPDAFLLDVEMPRMDGYDLLRTLREEDAFQETPIIMVSSRSGEKHRQQAVSFGATEYVTKPFQDNKLIRTIQQHLA